MRPTLRLNGPMPLMKLASQPFVMPRTTKAPLPSAQDRAALHPLRDRENYFHGVGLDAPLAATIWKTGIMSHKEASRRCMVLTPMFLGGSNGKDKISVSRYMGERFSYGTYSAGMLSFVIDGRGLPAEDHPYAGFSDEYHVTGAIEPGRIRAILIPARKLDLPIASLHIGLTGGLNANLHNKTQAYLSGVRAITRSQPDEGPIAAKVEAYARLSRDAKLSGAGQMAEAAVEKAVAAFTAEAYGQALGESEPTLRDVLDATLPADACLVEV